MGGLSGLCGHSQGRIQRIVSLTEGAKMCEPTRVSHTDVLSWQCGPGAGGPDRGIGGGERWPPCPDNRRVPGRAGLAGGDVRAAWVCGRLLNGSTGSRDRYRIPKEKALAIVPGWWLTTAHASQGGHRPEVPAWHRAACGGGLEPCAGQRNQGLAAGLGRYRHPVYPDDRSHHPSRPHLECGVPGQPRFGGLRRSKGYLAPH